MIKPNKAMIMVMVLIMPSIALVGFVGSADAHGYYRSDNRNGVRGYPMQDQLMDGSCMLLNSQGQDRVQ